MPRLRILALLSVASAVGACHDSPTHPAAAAPAPPALQAAAVAIPSSACTRTWTSGIGGLWLDAGRWTPAGVPAPGDVVCIDAPGTYTVQLASPTDVASLRIGGPGAEVTLEWDPVVASTFAVSDTLEVAAGSRFEIPSVGGHVIGGNPGPTLINDGRLTVSNPCACGGLLARFEVARIRNGGTLDLTAPIDVWLATDARVINTGVIVGRAAGTSPIDFLHRGGATGARWLQRSGSVVGLAPIQIFFPFDWSGGELEPSPHAVSVWNSDVVLQTSRLDGTLHLTGTSPGTTRVTGIIGRDVTLRALGTAQRSYAFDRQTAGPTINEGVLHLWTSSADSMSVVLPGLVNRGEWRVTGPVLVLADSIVNQGEVSYVTDARLSVAGPGGAGSPNVFKNKGTIDADTSTLHLATGTTFQANAGSVMDGVLELDRATLTGAGTVGDVIAFGARILPGNGTGTLTMASALLDSATEVVIEVEGATAGEFDAVAVAGALSATGTLTVETDPAFVGGQCGQALPLITHDGSASVSFAAVNGLGLDAARAWRLHTRGGTATLVGFDPAGPALASHPDALHLAEGQGPQSYSLCLGPDAPTADVQVSTTSILGQVLTEGAKTFTVDDWMLPLEFLTSALDDSVLEGLHTDTIRHTVVSTDPRYGGVAAPSVTIEIEDNDAEADLVLTQVSQEYGQVLGDTMDNVFRVANSGPSASSGSTVVTTPLVGLAFVSAAGAACTADAAEVITCAIGPLAAGARAEFTLTLEGIQTGLHTTTLSVTGQDTDPVASNNAVVYTQRIN
ncbi:MAG: hypothetical protein R3E98_07170 [Gemmatimonadota bacterium]